MTSKRAKEWCQFSDEVFDHIENYTVKQYGDVDNDLASDYTAEQCVQQIKKYVTRFGNNQRFGQEQLDMVKIAHYAQMAYKILGQ